MTPTHARRLLLLARKLDRVPKRRFNFRFWVGDDWGGAKDLSCGTSACALGWATTLPSLQRLGLSLIRKSDTNTYGDVVLLRPGKRRLDANGAAKAVFGLDKNGFERLFIPHAECRMPYGQGVCRLHRDRLPDDATPKQVAKNIRKYVEEQRGSRAKR